MNILYFEKIEDLRLETGLLRMPKEPDFHIFKFSDLINAKNFMPPYRRGFYQLTLIQNFGESTMTINNHNFSNHKDILYFVGPEHVLSWYRDKTVTGYLIYFKSSFLELSNAALEEKLTYFNPYRKNLIELENNDLHVFRNYFEHIFKEQNECKAKYRRQILNAQLFTILYKCQQIYEDNIEIKENNEKSIVTLFKKYVDNNYIQIKTINEYADLMNLSSNYLSQIIKNETGKNAKRIIDERVILESKNMLIHTNMTSAQIAYHLGFSEPTHFSRFFKKIEGITPKQFKEKSI